MELLANFLGKGFMVMLSISMPVVLTAAGIGLVIGVLQAVTQIQEQTIVAAPKIFMVFAVIIVGGYTFMNSLTNNFHEGANIAFTILPKAEQYVLPADFHQYTKPAEGIANISALPKPDIRHLMEFLGKSLLSMLAISMPVVLTAAGVGLILGIIQAVTQVQEQTIVAAPKIFMVFLVIVLLGFGFIKILKNDFMEGYALAFQVTPREGDYVLPSNYYQYTTPFGGEMSDGVDKKSKFNELMKNPGKVPFIDRQQKIKYDPNRNPPMPKPNFVETNKILGW